MIFLGNPASPHLDTWRALYARRGRVVSALYTIHAPRGQFPRERRVAAAGKTLSYAALGLWLRWGARRGGVLHAHGASGYGLAALLSGRPYVVTIYGSELLASRGRAYAAMIRRVLQHARVVTVTSRAAAKRLREIDPALGDRVLCFHTGIDPERLAGVAADRAHGEPSGPLRAMCIRNCGPQYRTREVVLAVKSIAGEAPPFILAIPLGNGDPGYFARLRAEFDEPWLEFIDEALPHEAFLASVRDAEICINFPRSDQTSATLIEALWFDRPILTANLEAYAELFAHTADYKGWGIVDDEAALARAFVAMARAVMADRGRLESSGHGPALVAAHYGPEAAAERLDPILKVSQA